MRWVVENAEEAANGRGAVLRRTAAATAAVAATVEHEQVARSAVDMYAGAGSVGVKELRSSGINTF